MKCFVNLGSWMSVVCEICVFILGSCGLRYILATLPGLN